MDISILVPVLTAVTILVLFYYFYRYTPLSVSMSVVLLSMVATILVSFGESLGYPMYEYLGFNPAVIAVKPWTIYTVLTSIFVHGGFTHWLFNSLALMLLCSSFEHMVGKKEFMKVFILSAIAAELTHVIITLTLFRNIYGPVVTRLMLKVTLVGASGAIFGILAAYAILFPHHRVVMFIGFLPLPGIPIGLAAFIIILMQVFAMLFQPFSTTAYTAHVGGAIGGVVYAYLIYGKTQPSYGFGYPSSRGMFSRRRRFKVPFVPSKPKYDFDALKEFVFSPYDEELLRRAMEDEEYRDYWISKLVSTKTCPKCGFYLEYDDVEGVIRCINCGYTVKIKR
ncbi:MAG: hypothetical protein DRN30_02585 [Thermoplasmata archaeon]|nr:MAG: hypothetical protein DRN30_02585 [Thermoplasmata archaeon]